MRAFRPLAFALLTAAPLALACPASSGGEVADGPAGAATSQDDGEVVEFDQAHAAWSAILEENVVGDRFDYEAVREDRAALEAYLEQLHAVTPATLATWTDDERFAFWINVYNAHVVDLIVERDPRRSINDLSTSSTPVWKLEFIPMGAFDPDGKGRPLSLDEVEHRILRVQFEDARVHVAVNCASIGCPPLRGEAFRAEDLDEQLDEQMRAFLADSERNRFDAGAERVRVSKIFEWFADDFERDAGSVRAYLARYAPGDDTGWVESAKVGYLDYDWDLNAVERD